MNEDLANKAAALLEKCETVALASINEKGYPRICVVSKIKNDGFSCMHFATGTNSHKTAHFRKDDKASVCYTHGADSVTLLGKIEIIEDMEVKKALWQDWFICHFPKGVDDPEYCVLKFSANEATFWIDSRFETHSC